MQAWSKLFILLVSAHGLCACSSDNAKPPTASVPVPFAVTGDWLGVWDGKHYKPVFIKGMNLGVAVPGTLAGELAATREQYDRWFEQMGAMGVNALRTYTLHYPRFYDAIAHYNRTHPEAPLYVLHGIWLDEENPTHDFFDMSEEFDLGIDEVIDCSHGHRNIAERRGRAHGKYTSDITPWVIGWVIGREIIPAEVTSTNLAHANHTSYTGKAISLPHGTPLEAWFAERLDRVVMHERDNYGVERPVSVSSWPTLDPLRHPSEFEKSEEDIESLDLENLDTSQAPGGYFASYHAYPYYPDFMTQGAEYQAAEDRRGGNTYYGYLSALKAHYVNHPLLIAEFGIPSSWGNAHYGAAHMNHGGQNELEQGEQAARLLENLLDTHCAGGAFFAWIDEWWKRTWIVDPLTFPRSHYPLWHNVTSPEQNFGMIAFDLGAPRYKRWPAVTGSDRLRSVQADLDAEFFHVRVQLSAALPAAEALSIGFDTYGDDVGESRLPGGATTERRNEFALVITAPDQAQLYVTEPYDMFGIWHGVSEPKQLFHSVASDAGNWQRVRWRNNRGPEGAEEASGPENTDEVGRFQFRAAGAPEDIRAGITISGTTIDVRVPWVLLQFADPTTRSVIDDNRATKDTETATSAGIALSVQLADNLIETERLVWDGWTEAPDTVEREKQGVELVRAALRELP